MPRVWHCSRAFEPGMSSPLPVRHTLVFYWHAMLMLSTGFNLFVCVPLYNQLTRTLLRLQEHRDYGHVL